MIPLMIVVLPVPGPPVSKKTGATMAALIASSWSWS